MHAETRVCLHLKFILLLLNFNHNFDMSTSVSKTLQYVIS